MINLNKVAKLVRIVDTCIKHLGEETLSKLENAFVEVEQEETPTQSPEVGEIVKIQTISSNNSNDFDERVNTAILHGWKVVAFNVLPNPITQTSTAIHICTMAKYRKSV